MLFAAVAGLWFSATEKPFGCWFKINTNLVNSATASGLATTAKRERSPTNADLVKSLQQAKSPQLLVPPTKNEAETGVETIATLQETQMTTSMVKV